jgi:GTP-binding protein
VVPVSAAHGQGVRSMLEAALDALALPEGEEGDEPEDDGSIRLAVAGRPNVGKSTSSTPGWARSAWWPSTCPPPRDAIRVPFEKGGQKFSLIDTAGLRRKGKVFEAIEKFSVVKTCRPSSRPTSCCCCWTPRRA